MRFGSLFTGVGGFDLGFERAGLKCAWQVEQDKFCSQVLERHWPNVRRYEDVREVGKENLEAVDLICGGFPCQDLSVAGKRAGFDGERSSLWFEFERIIDEMRPKWVVIENVPGLLSSENGADFAVILKSLDECGYGVAWRIFDSKNFRVAQRRRRVFIMASLGNMRCGQVLFECESMSGNIEKGRETRQGIAWSIKERAGKPGGGKGIMIDQFNSYGLNSSSSLYVMASGQSNAEIESERRTALTGLHEQPIVCLGGQHPNTAVEYNISPTLTEASEKGGGHTPIVWEPRSPDGVPRIHDDGKIPTLNAMKGGQRQPCVGVRRLTPTECCRLQGFPDDWNDNVSDTQRYCQMGNAVTVNVVEWIGKRIIKEN